MSQQNLGSSDTPPVLGCIADDFTGATDLAGALVLNGMRTTVMLGVPEAATRAQTDAIVIALKSRTAPRAHAIDVSLAALQWLRKQGCRKFFFKYCSTFDSTANGNIGPVTEALMAELNTPFTVACPALPANGRTVYNGYLFVGGALLQESSMAHHPLTPMRDSSLLRLLQAQTSGRVGSIVYKSVRHGRQEIANAVAALRVAGVKIAIVDAVTDSDLREIVSACEDLPLWTGASGMAIGIPDVLRSQGLLSSSTDAALLHRVPGFSAILSGSCSDTTQRQVNAVKRFMPTFHIDPLRAIADPELSGKALEWACAHLPDGPVLISATASSGVVKSAQARLGVRHVGDLIESILARIACGLVQHGVRRLIVAGGETSGAVVEALGVRSLRIGPRIDHGVHWAIGEDDMQLALALKSGNFGGDDFFTKAWSLLP